MSYNCGEIFDEIYETNTWGVGSGNGSLYKHNIKYIKFLESFYKKHKITSIVDFGCGDWQFSQKINFDGIDYTGYDVSSWVIEKNRAAFAKDNIKFEYTPDIWGDVKSADLLICKDVLQHLSTENIHLFIQKVLPKFKYALITNCLLPLSIINIEIQNGEFRPLDLRQEPFNVPMREVMAYLAGHDLKVCFLFDSPQYTPKSVLTNYSLKVRINMMKIALYHIFVKIVKFWKIIHRLSE